MCEKTRMEYAVKNSRNSLLKTLVKLSFDLEIFALKHVDITTDVGKKN